MPAFAEVHHSQWIAAPVETVRAQFADVDHHIQNQVHPTLRFEPLPSDPEVVRFVQEVKLLGLRQRDVIERRQQPDGSLLDQAVSGFNQGGSLHFRFAPQTEGGRAGTRVDIRIRLPLPPVVGPLLRPLMERQIRKEVSAAALEDKADIETRGYPRSTRAAQADSAAFSSTRRVRAA